jgi:hypothetical protein
VLFIETALVHKLHGYVEVGEQTLLLYEFKLICYARVTSRLVSLDPSLNVMNKSTSNSVYDVLLKEKPGILVRVHLFQIQTIPQRYFVSLPKLCLQSLVTNIRLLPLAVLSHCLVSEPWGGEADVATRAHVSCWRWFIRAMSLSCLNVLRCLPAEVSCLNS